MSPVSYFFTSSEWCLWCGDVVYGGEKSTTVYNVYFMSVWLYLQCGGVACE